MPGSVKDNRPVDKCVRTIIRLSVNAADTYFFNLVP
jgi:hypothetical protein